MTDAVPYPAAPRWVRWWVAAVVLCAFGPYIAGGVRTEQVAVYGSAAAVLVAGAPVLARRPAGVRGPVGVLAAWGALLLVAGTGALWTPRNRTGYEYGSALAGLDSLALPLALLIVTWYWASLAPASALVRSTAKTIVAAMCANAVLAVASISAGAPAWLRGFWAAAGPGATTAERAADGGRLSGVFNQPAEAGIGYSLAVICLVYLARTSARSRPLVVLAAGVALMAGGVLTGSKVFLLGGLPLLAYLVLRDRRRRGGLVLTGAAGAGVYLMADWWELLPDWSGTGSIGRLLSGDSPLLGRITAGRLGEDGTLAEVSAQIWQHHAVAGVGLRGLDVAYDSMWVEAFVLAGVLGVLAMGAVVLLLIARWWSLRVTMLRPEWMLAGAVIALTVAASIGFPSLTGNRVSTLVWVLLGLLVATRGAPHTAPERVRRPARLLPA